MTVAPIADALPEQHIQADAVAAHLDMSRKWVFNATRRLDDPLPHRAFGRSIRFLLSEVDEWAARQKRGRGMTTFRATFS
jgi:predicted DNA-binding transcriptional regulator AlpA